MFNAFGQKAKLTVAGVMEGFTKILEDLEAVVDHHDDEADVLAGIITDAQMKRGASVREANDARSVIAKISRLISPEVSQ